MLRVGCNSSRISSNVCNRVARLIKVGRDCCCGVCVEWTLHFNSIGACRYFQSLSCSFPNAALAFPILPYLSKKCSGGEDDEVCISNVVINSNWHHDIFEEKSHKNPVHPKPTFLILSLECCSNLVRQLLP